METFDRGLSKEFQLMEGSSNVSYIFAYKAPKLFEEQVESDYS